MGCPRQISLRSGKSSRVERAKNAPRYSSGFANRDLADIRKEGKLSKDEFAVAMFLINNKLAGKDLPSSLSQSMIPPSLRNHSAVTQPQSKRSFY